MRNEPFETQMLKNLAITYYFNHSLFKLNHIVRILRKPTGNRLQPIFISPLFTKKKENRNRLLTPLGRTGPKTVLKNRFWSGLVPVFSGSENWTSNLYV